MIENIPLNQSKCDFLPFTVLWEGSLVYCGAMPAL